ncbi:MAG: Xaa-Pro dipeptidase [Planctomycetes bacterium]|nr:Xaa-Pro dipeptidase [Planctomycetota bacterium]
MVAERYALHVAERQRRAEAVLAAAGYDGYVVSSGKPFTHYADDMDAPFHSVPHFAHWLPLDGPHHLLHVRTGKRAQVVRYAPEDYWYEQLALGDVFWRAHFELSEVPEASKAWSVLKLAGRTAYLGDEPELARAAGIREQDINPAGLIARLDWERAYKTDYEVACLEVAEAAGARGHLAALAAFERGASELAIHHEYLAAVGCTEEQLPYHTIIALDHKGATLHYTGKRGGEGGRVLLIDCGAEYLGYGSDITRTWTRKGCDATFRDLVKGVDQLQQRLCARVKPGIDYLELHVAAHDEIANLLHELGVLRLGGREAVELGLTRPFFPHGLGHFLGIQVHDVGGRQKAPEGGLVPPPAAYPFLRTTRRVEERQVFTIEPGVYFIEMLLRAHRQGASAQHFDWALIDRLTPFGGVRVEDDVLVIADGHRNLTRPHV